MCINEDQVKKDARERAAIVDGLKEKLSQGPKALVGNKGYRKYLANQPGGFVIDEAKVKNEAR